MEEIDLDKLTRSKLIDLINKIGKGENHRPFKINLEDSNEFVVHKHEMAKNDDMVPIENREFHLVDDGDGWLHLQFEKDGSKLKEHGVNGSHNRHVDPVQSSKAATKTFRAAARLHALNKVVSNKLDEEE